MKYEKDIQRVLRRLGANGTYRGFNYTVYGIKLSMEDRERLLYVTKGLYLDIAEQYQTSWKCVERDIRTIVDVIWRTGDHELLREINGGRLDEKPKNVKFLEMLTEYMLEIENESV